MLKTVFIVSCILAGLYAKNVNFYSHPPITIMEDIINKSVECVRETLDEGLPDKGLPSFNPLRIDNLTLNFDHLNLTEYISGWAHLENGISEHLVDFFVTDIIGTFILFPPTYIVNFTMKNDNVSSHGIYKINSTILGHNIWGEGSIIVGMENFNLSGHVKAVIENMKVDLKEVAAPAKMEKFIFQITGLFGNETYSEELSKRISENVPKIINENPDLFLDFVGPLFVALFNALVNDDIGFGIIQEMVQKCIIDVIFPPFMN